VDRLTGLADARKIHAWLAQRAGAEQLSLVLFDVDDTAALNERRGHQAVDRLLARLGSIVRERCGADDVAARIGGDEFALSLWDADVEEALHEVERLRGGFRAASGGATLSAGICDSATLRRNSQVISLYHAAGDALHEAKRQRPEGLVIFSARG